LKTVNWNALKPFEPNLFFVNKDFKHNKLFASFIDLRTLFVEKSMGIATGNDENLVKFKDSEIRNIYKSATPFYYRPFDIRYTIFDNTILQRARFKLMSNYSKNNVGLNVVRQSKLKGVETLITNNITNRDFITNHTYNFPLYIYPETNTQQTIGQPAERTPNLNAEMLKKLAKKLGLTFTNEKESTKNTFAPIDILDYIYAVLHSAAYREKYKEFLKIDFPRVPYPKDANTFWQLVKLGAELRELHLLENPILENYITKYPIDGNNVVSKVKFVVAENSFIQTNKNISNAEIIDGGSSHDNISFPQYHLKSNDDTMLHEPDETYGNPNTLTLGKVYINETQYFDNVPEVAWNFYIGGYQPAQKWLKDRKDIKLEFDDILHYQKIIVALTQTDKLMKEIEKIDFE
jgi:hypothetical protein